MWFDTLKDLLTSRGSQLLARYTGIGLVWLSAKIGVVFSPEQLTSVSSGLSMLVIGAILFGLDLWIHGKKKA